jgi:hypothetical protein
MTVWLLLALSGWWQDALAMAQAAYPPARVFLEQEADQERWWPEPSRTTAAAIAQNLVKAVHEGCHGYTHSWQSQSLNDGRIEFALYPDLEVFTIPSAIGGQEWPPVGIIGSELPREIRKNNFYYRTYLTNIGTSEFLEKMALEQADSFLADLAATPGVLERAWQQFSPNTDLPDQIDSQDPTGREFLLFLARQLAPSASQAHQGPDHLLNEYNCYVHGGATALGLIKLQQNNQIPGLESTSSLSSEAYALASFQIFAVYYLSAVKNMYPDFYRGALAEPGVAEIFLALHQRSGELIQALTPLFNTGHPDRSTELQNLLKLLAQPENQEILHELRARAKTPRSPTAED